MNNKKDTRINSKAGDEEVEELLQAAQDELMLKLSVDSHISRVSTDYLLPDLDRRFQALKSRPSSSSSSSANTPNQKHALNQPRPPPNYDDLFSRFAALKASSSTPVSVSAGLVPDSEDEVEKIIRWAKDAARLEPSPPSDDEDETADGRQDSDEEDFK